VKPSFFGQNQMADVDRIKGAAKDADAVAGPLIA